MTHTYDPDDEIAFDSANDILEEIHQELSDYNESWAQSNEDGWFYSDED